MVISIAAFDFSTEATRHAMKEALSTQEATRRYVDRFANVGILYIIALVSVQQASLQANYNLQSALVQAIRAVIETTLQWSQAILNTPQPASLDRGFTPAVAGGEPISRGRRLPPLADEDPAPDPAGAVAAALAFQPPLGVVVSGYGGGEEGS